MIMNQIIVQYTFNKSFLQISNYYGLKNRPKQFPAVEAGVKKITWTADNPKCWFSKLYVVLTGFGKVTRVWNVTAYWG